MPKNRNRSDLLHDDDMDVGKEQIIVKVMILGDSCTGKTCLLIRYKDGAFLNNNFISTVGIDYRLKEQQVDQHGRQESQAPGITRFSDFLTPTNSFSQIWDTAGQERFRSVATSYYRDADALLLVYDIANRQSFDNVRDWLSHIKEHGKEAVQVTLVGNKCDLPRVVQADEGRRLAEENGIPFMETSAKTGQNVDRAFLGLAERMIKMKYGFVPGGEMADTIAVNESKSINLSNCCLIT
ncbi:Protein CBR-RAB-37 [Caenorhabditis briggsae]|uniref:Protein CBR-RAB-37 n=1 Tax=Caenorhabditis briggsae TaxID=6238 RepID=A8XJV0_CAEBR|nr:Protein CBR-RAB-37 [Caenorhabditis briggsae]CAP32926.2 Protein CBR-RAB-37 [Caenorhabditis briggsae]